MSNELKPQASIDSDDFIALLGDWGESAWGNSADEEMAHKALAAIIVYIDAWGARLAGDAAKDAERYRWLRDKARGEWNERIFVTDDGHKDYYEPNGIYESELDDVVDKAMDAVRKDNPCGS